MNESHQEGCVVVVILVVAALVIGFISFVCGRGSALEELRADAIEAGAGEWTIDPKTGKEAFVFECDCKE